MSKKAWYIIIGTGMVLMSAVLYAVQYAIFGDGRHMFTYLMLDLAFLPLEVLFVTLIVDSLLSTREKRSTMNKMNMVIGAFFSEVGTGLLRKLRGFDVTLDEHRTPFTLSADFSEAQLAAMRDALLTYPYSVDVRVGDLADLRDFLVARRDFMVRLLENPMLLEHERFTDLLWAVFHLTDELSTRERLTGLPEADLDHLSGDMQRAYSRLGGTWCGYLAHLQSNYPYLFSLAVRTNPFDPTASVEIG